MIEHDRRMVEPPATPHRGRWLHIVRDGEAESAPPAPDDDPPGEPRRPALPSVFSRTPPGGANPGGWAPPDPTTPTPRRTPTPLPDSGRAHGGPTDAGSGPSPPSTPDTARPAGYGSLAEPPPARAGIVGRGQKVVLSGPAVVCGPGIVRGCRRSGLARMAVRGLPGDGRCRGAGSGYGRPGLLRLISRGRPGRRLVCRRRAGLEPRRRYRGRVTRGARGTPVREFEHSRCRGRAIARAFGRRAGPRQARDPGAG